MKAMKVSWGCKTLSRPDSGSRLLETAGPLHLCGRDLSRVVFPLKKITSDFSESSLIVPSTLLLSCLIVLTAESANLMSVERGVKRDLGIYHKGTEFL